MNDRRDLTPNQPPQEKVERLERWQALEAGTYWRSVEEVEITNPSFPSHRIKIAPGTVLLLVGIDYFDGRPHTINLRYHPLKGKGTYRLLVEAFLDGFEPAQDGEAVRQREMQQLQEEVAEIQQELLEGQSNPQLLGPVIEEELGKWESEQADKAEPPPSGQRKALADPRHGLRSDLSGVLSTRPSAEDVQGLRAYVEREAKIAEIKANWIRERTDKIGQKLAALAPFFEEQAAVALARTQDVRQHAQELLQGIASMDLYVGTGVEVETLREGASAPREEPLTLMQRKLFMDEELAAYAEVDDRFDFQRVEEFDKRLAADPRLRDQILPTPRCVVSMAVRRRDLDYGDAWVNEAKNAINKLVFLLVRDGENLYRVYSAAPSHEYSARLFPTHDEHEKLFRGIDGERITYRDVRFTDNAQRSKDLALHYKRFLILLCGLDHRLQLFGEFYDPARTGEFMTRRFQEDYFRFVADDESDRLIGDGKPDVGTWIREKNSYLQSGSRVLCYHHDLISPETAPACQRYRRDYPEVLASPLRREELLIAHREGKDIFVGVEVKRDSYRAVKQERFTARVNLSLAATTSAPGFLCLDAISTDELRHYIYNRASRIRHLAYLRLFKRALAVLEQDEAEEAPARAYLRAAALEGRQATEDEIDALVDESVRTWRAANRGAPLPPESDRPALEPLLNYIFTVQHSQRYIRMAEAFALEHGHQPLKLVLTGRNKLGLYVEVPPEERSEELMAWRWVRRINLTVQKTKLSEASSRLAWLRTTPNAKEKELKRWPALADWENEEKEPLRPSELAAAVEMVRTSFPTFTSHLRSAEGGISGQLFEELFEEFRSRLYDHSGKFVPSVYLSLPIGAYRLGTRLMFLVLHAPMELWLKHYANEAQWSQVNTMFTGIYAKPEAARKRLTKPFAPALRATTAWKGYPVQLLDSPCEETPQLTEAREEYAEGTSGGSWISWRKVTGHRGLDETLEQWVALCDADATARSQRFRPPERHFLCEAIWRENRAHISEALGLSADSTDQQ